ncbi:hypothetical protein [Burkholderia vietnamiensis]|uniref:hypothetical protein n=1 Tax=Burkholderia vietnamiensis TaxID=60552 RepID=UPI001CF5245F|nr:hypothetical protein [Burkholderia vietnamiensis]MCA7948380.1 hypothetical protein [Burkholderia vietnamiensis]
MNCKIGDMAIIIRGKATCGRIVEVVDVCPRNVYFKLPDGFWHSAVNYEWIVRFQNPIEAPTDAGCNRTTVYAPIPDRFLRPITGLPITDDVEDEVTA